MNQRIIFETNDFLIKYKCVQGEFFKDSKEIFNPTLIEYSAFFGSLNIFKYLKTQEVPIPKETFIYGIHGNNAEMIHFIENLKLELNTESYLEMMKESIKCHHSLLCKYLQNNYLTISTINEQSEKEEEEKDHEQKLIEEEDKIAEQKQKQIEEEREEISKASVASYNYEYFPESFDKYHFELIDNDHFYIIKHLIEEGKMNINEKYRDNI